MQGHRAQINPILFLVFLAHNVLVKRQFASPAKPYGFAGLANCGGAKHRRGCSSA